MIHTFMGLTADEWANATPDSLPIIPWTGERCTTSDILAAIAAMLTRQDDEFRDEASARFT